MLPMIKEGGSTAEEVIRGFEDQGFTKEEIKMRLEQLDECFGQE
jgi:hypothetical protein